MHQDQSINASDQHFPRQLCIGTLRHVLDSARSQDGPILNALSFPLALAGMRCSALSSEIEAWRLTERMKFCNAEASFPIGDMRWGLAATRGGRHWVHIDSDGLATFIDVRCGGKWWIIFTPLEGQDKYIFASIDQFFDGFETINPPGRYSAEAIYLTPGTRL